MEHIMKLQSKNQPSLLLSIQEKVIVSNISVNDFKETARETKITNSDEVRKRLDFSFDNKNRQSSITRKDQNINSSNWLGKYLSGL